MAFSGPASVMVGDLTFVRPKNWKWEEPAGKSAAQSRFMLPLAKGEGVSAADVRFYIEDKDGPHGESAWKSHFPQVGPGKLRSEQKRIGKRELSYLILSGNYFAGEKAKKKTGQMLLGATITFGPKVIIVRALGAEHVVKAAMFDFKRMVEEALKDKAAE